MKRALAFIPARKGSKGIPGKNTRLLCGKPLVAWTLEAALACDDVAPFVSTDDEAVVALAEQRGIYTEYRRPASLATDETPMTDVVADGLSWLAGQGRLLEPVLLLQPTSPLRNRADIAAAVELLCSGATPIVAVSRLWTHPADCVRLDADGRWSYLVPPALPGARRQDYPDNSCFYINGAIYGFFASRFLASRSFVPPEARLLVIDDINSIDIDTERDFRVTESILRWRQESE